MDSGVGSNSSVVFKLERLASLSTEDNIGDVLVAALSLSSTTKDALERQQAEFFLGKIRRFAKNADIGWRIFESPPRPSHPLSEEEAIQLINTVGGLGEFCYAAERLDEVSFLTWESSTPVRFYINSIYHYISALFLLDKRKLPMGGTMFKTLDPMGLAPLLEPIGRILDEPMGKDITFGETVRQVRNDFLVHGRFSPIDIRSVVKQTQMHDIRQKYRLVQLIWELFNQTLVLRLSLIATLTASGLDLAEIADRHAFR